MFCDEDVHVIISKKATPEQVQVDKLYVCDEHEALSIVNNLKNLKCCYVPIKKDGNCMYRTILSCINVPAGVTVSGFRKQITFYIMHNIKFFRKRLSLGNSENMESFLRNLIECFDPEGIT